MALRKALTVGAVCSIAVLGLALPVAASPLVPAPACKTPADEPAPDSQGGPWQSAELPADVRPPGPNDPCPDETGNPIDDPNPNTNPRAKPKLWPGMGASTDTAVCRPGRTCTVEPPAGPDSRFRIDASGGTERAVLFGVMNGNFRPADTIASGRPNCPDYRERNSDWVQFGFLDSKRGASWRKSAVMTLRQKLSKGSAERLAQDMQVCFAAPYSFPTRDGYRLGRSGPDRVGVLASCGSVTRSAPCLARREIAKVRGGWVVRLAFKIPANGRDPKALG